MAEAPHRRSSALLKHRKVHPTMNPFQHPRQYPQESGGSDPSRSASEERRAEVLRELQALEAEASLLKALKEQQPQASALAENPANDAPSLHTVPDAERSKTLRAAILAKTVGSDLGPNNGQTLAQTDAQTGAFTDGLSAAPSREAQKPNSGSARQQRLQLRQAIPAWAGMAAAAVLGVALIGAWFALRSEAEASCETLACMLDALPVESLLDLNEGTMVQDARVFDEAWAFAAEAVEAGFSETEDRSSASDMLDDLASVPSSLEWLDSDPLVTQSSDWNAADLDEASLDALEALLLGP
jgi:hypothetical protein